MPIICSVRIFFQNEMPYFQVCLRDKTLRCCNTACFPCPADQGRGCGCRSLLSSFTEDCSLLQLEGLCLLPPECRRGMLAFFAECASRQGAPLLVL